MKDGDHRSKAPGWLRWDGFYSQYLGTDRAIYICVSLYWGVHALFIQKSELPSHFGNYLKFRRK